MQNKIKDIKKYGVVAKGKRELIKHLRGEQLTFRETLLAKCYDCLGYYRDGKMDCNVPNCPLYQFMPYREETKKAFSDEQKVVLQERMQKVRLKRVPKTDSFAVAH